MAKRPNLSKQERERRRKTAGASGIALFIILVFSATQLSELRDTKRPIDEVEQVLRRLGFGIAAFNAPAIMTRGKPQIVTLIVSVKDSGAYLSQLVIKATGDTTSKIEVAPVRVSPRMTARLEGQGFRITPTASEATPVVVPASSRTEWDWQVTPVSSGEQLLVLTLDAVIRLKTGDAPIRQTVLRRVIHVEVTKMDRMRDASDWVTAHWILLSALATLALLIFKAIQGRRRNPAGFHR